MNQLSLPPTGKQSTDPYETGTPKERDQGFNNRTSPREFKEPVYVEFEVPSSYALSTPAYVVDDVVHAGIVINGDDSKINWYQEKRIFLAIIGLVITDAVLITLDATGVFRTPPQN